MSTDDSDQDDVAGHFQLPPETFDDDAVRAVRPQAPAAPAAGTVEDDDDVAGHVHRTYPKAVGDGTEDDVEGHSFNI